MSVKNKAVEIDFFERNLASDINSHHNHAGDPGKENVGTGFHDV